jgi:hypothetical protein
MKKNHGNARKALRVSRETLRMLDASELTEVAGGQFVPTKQILPTVCLACQN